MFSAVHKTSWSWEIKQVHFDSGLVQLLRWEQSIYDSFSCIGQLRLCSHARPIGRKKLQPRNNFCIFYSFELKLCRMVELCIPKNPVIFAVSILTVFQVMSKQISNFGRAWRLYRKNCEKFLEKLNCIRRYSILKGTYVSKNSNKMAGNSKIKA